MFFAGNESGKWYLDLKNGAGSCGKGEASTDADCTFKMKDEHFQQMFTGKWIIKTYVKSTRQNSDDITTYRKKSHTIFVKWTIALQWLLEFHVYNSIGFYKINFFVYSRKVETCFCLYEWKNETSRRHGQSIEIGEGYGSNEIKIISHHDAQSSTR